MPGLIPVTTLQPYFAALGAHMGQLFLKFIDYVFKILKT